MKLFMEFVIEILNILAGFQLDNELWIIMCYTIICCVSDLDYTYYTILDSSIKNQLVNYLEYQLPMKRSIRNKDAAKKLMMGKVKDEDSIYPNLSKSQKVCYVIMLGFDFFYEIAYFYFFPYLALMVVMHTHFSDKPENRRY